MAPPDVPVSVGCRWQVSAHDAYAQIPTERVAGGGNHNEEGWEWEVEEQEEGRRLDARRRETTLSMSTRAYEEEQLVDVMSDDSDDNDDDIEKCDGVVDGGGVKRESLPFSWRKLWAFTGPGFLVSIAYLDPGNLESDLQAGSQAGYQLLWVLLWATVMGLFIQLLSARLGVATGRHLAELCGETYPRPVNYLLWAMAEIAIVGSDIQEVMGTAIAVRILSGYRIPIWAGVLITAVDSFFLLFLENLGVRKLEAFFAGCIIVMMSSFVAIFVSVAPDPAAITKGLLIPYVSASAAKQAVGIIGAVIMPHNIFLHSALVQSRKISSRSTARVKEAVRYYSIESTAALAISFFINMAVTCIFAKVFSGREDAASIGLVNAGEKLAEQFPGAGISFLLVWAIGLLSAGQSSTMTGTYAGQFVMAGFLDLPIGRLKRALLTRGVAIGPTLAVAVWCHSSPDALDSISSWLNVLQAFQLPFAVIPLLKLSSRPLTMGAFKLSSSLQALAWVISLVIVSTNGYLLVVFISEKMGNYSIAGFAVLATFAAFYLSFMMLLALGPDNAHHALEIVQKTLGRVWIGSEHLQIDGVGDSGNTHDDLRENLISHEYRGNNNDGMRPKKEKGDEVWSTA